jgi:hypothetical protein
LNPWLIFGGKMAHSKDLAELIPQNVKARRTKKD